MKEMIRYGGKDREIRLISKLRWNKWLDMMYMTGKWMNKQIEMKQIIIYDVHDGEMDE
jgi:hypothetical protein